MNIVTSEDFKLTESINEEIEKVTSTIQSHLKKEASIKLMLSKTSEHCYKVVFDMHMNHKELSAHAEDRDFYKALRVAKNNLLSQVRKEKSHREKLRKQGI